MYSFGLYKVRTFIWAYGIYSNGRSGFSLDQSKSNKSC